jgi:hypothetical protein
MKVKRYVVELHDKASQAGWPQRQAGIDAVFDITAMPSRVQANATDEAIEKIRKGLGGDFQAEEIAGREPQG